MGSRIFRKDVGGIKINFVWTEAGGPENIVISCFSQQGILQRTPRNSLEKQLYPIL